MKQEHFVTGKASRREEISATTLRVRSWFADAGGDDKGTKVDGMRYKSRDVL